MKTRFAVLYFNEKKQLFSVNEGSDNSLYIFHHCWKTSFGGDGLVDVKNQKISIHPKSIHNMKLCNKIKFELKTVSGDNYDKSIIVSDVQKTGFLFPITNIIASSLESSDFNLKPRKNDEVIELF